MTACHAAVCHLRAHAGSLLNMFSQEHVAYDLLAVTLAGSAEFWKYDAMLMACCMSGNSMNAWLRLVPTLSFVCTSCPNGAASSRSFLVCRLIRQVADVEHLRGKTTRQSSRRKGHKHNGSSDRASGLLTYGPESEHRPQPMAGCVQRLAPP